MLKRILKGASKHKVSYNDNDNDNDKGAPSKTYKPDPDVENEQLVDLYHATWIGDLATVKTLLTKLDNPNGRPHQPPLLAALKRGHKEIVDELLKHPKIDLNLTFFEATCLGTVVLNGDERNLETLLKQPKIDINQLSLSVTPLLIAVRMNHLNIVKMLLREPKIDVNKGVQSAAFDQAKSISTKFVISPIQYAAMKGQLEIVKLLLNDPRLDKTSLKWTPLHIACVTDDLNMFYQCIENINKALIASKVQNNSMHREDFNSRDSMEMTPMHYLANSKNLDMVKVLLQTEEVDLTLTEIMNKTPIWFAYCQILQNIKWMIASGKGLAIRTKSAGIPPEDWPTHAIQIAKDRGWKEIAELLPAFKDAEGWLRKSVRKDLRYEETFASDLLSILILLNEGYLRIYQQLLTKEKSTELKSFKNKVKFFQIVAPLPLEMQMQVCNRVYDIDLNFISSADLVASVTQNVNRLKATQKSVIIDE